MNILPFIEPFVREWVKGNDLIIQQIFDQHRELSLIKIIDQFIINKKLQGRINVPEVISNILSNKDAIHKYYGIKI
jgi:hypothetical protein